MKKTTILLILACALVACKKNESSKELGIRMETEKHAVYLFENDRRIVRVSPASNDIGIGVLSQGGDCVTLVFDREKFNPISMRRYVRKDGYTWLFEYDSTGEVTRRVKLLKLPPELLGQE